MIARNMSAVEAAVAKLFLVTEVVHKPPRKEKKVKQSREEAVEKDQRRKPAPLASVRQRLRKAISLYLSQLSEIHKTSRDKWTAQDAERVTHLEQAISSAKSTLNEIGFKTNKALRKEGKASKKKCTRVGAPVMELNPKHHKRKVHISKQERAINKSKDGKPTMNLATPPKSKLSVVGSVVSSLNIPEKNPAPRNRNERKKELGRYIVALRKPKHSPYKKVLKLSVAA